MSRAPETDTEVTYAIKGKPLSECTVDELHREWSAGMALESQVEFFSKEDNERLMAVEHEMCSRPETNQDKE